MYWPRLIKHWRQSLAGLILAIMGGAIYPRSALGMTWRELSRSLHSTFSQRHPLDHENIVGLALILIVFGLLVAGFRLYACKQQKGIEKFYNDRRQKRQQQEMLPDGKTQKRKWFRLKTRDWLRWFQFSGFTPLTDSQYKRDRMVDIGGGGLRFTTEQKLELGAIITFLLDIGVDEPLSVWGRVVRVQEKSGDDPQQYFVAIQFAQLPDADRQRLVAWIMQGQRDALHIASPGKNTTTAISHD